MEHRLVLNIRKLGISGNGLVAQGPDSNGCVSEKELRTA